MYCYKCGRKNKINNHLCKYCHSVLFDASENSNTVLLEEINEYKERVRLAKEYTPERSETVNYYNACLKKAEATFNKNKKRITAFYENKLALAATEKEKIKINENMNAELNEARDEYSFILKDLKDEKRAFYVMKKAQLYSEEANKRLPTIKDQKASHEYAQYLHKRMDNCKDGIGSSLSSLVVGLIILAVGLIFLILSFKIVPGDASTKSIRVDCLEFYVFVIGVSLGSISLLVGLILFIIFFKKRKDLNLTLVYFRIFHDIG